MDYKNSICFSPDFAEQLNMKAFAINNRLFLFAYYEPKEYVSTETFRSRFLTAVVNLYGLFWDCCPFMHKLLETHNSILLNDRTRIKDEFIQLRSIVGAFRGIFCHNNSDIYPLNAENYDTVESWISIQCGSSLAISDLNESHWEKLLQVLVDKAELFAHDLENSLDRLSHTTNVTRREQAIKSWVQSIAGNYLRNPDYLLNAMSAMYQLYMMNTRTSLNTSKSLRQQTIEWLVNNCSVDRQKWAERWLDMPVSRCSESKVYSLLLDWPNKWANKCGRPATECDEAPMPGGVFMRILASDVDYFACNPYLGYSEENQSLG